MSAKPPQAAQRPANLHLRAYRYTFGARTWPVSAPVYPSTLIHPFLRSPIPLNGFFLALFTGSALTVLAQPTAPYADSIRMACHIPELSYAVLDASGTREMAALGHHSVALPDPATLADRFHLASNTKAMTAFLIARYVEKGKLRWDTRFFDLFPGWQAASKPAYAAITLQDLLAHRAGLPALQGDADDPALPTFSGSRQQTRRDFARFVLTLNPVWPDAEHPFRYANAGYTLAALMLEKVSRKSWEQLVEQVFNHDLRLNVGFSWPENQRHSDTWGHQAEGGQLTPVASSAAMHLDYTEPAGDLNIRLGDYATFLRLYLDGLRGRDAYLKAATYRFMLQGLEHYAMGWYNIRENDTEFSTHSGTVGTYYTVAQIDRLRQKAYVVFTNAFTPETQQGVRLLLRRLKATYGH